MDLDRCACVCVFRCVYTNLTSSFRYKLIGLSPQKPEIQPFTGQDLNIRNPYPVLGCTPGLPESILFPTTTFLPYQGYHY